jgi:ribosomal protein L37AE/L43A
LKTDISLEDKNHLRELLRKPFSPYIFRHTSLTNKSKIINEVNLRQDAGWAGKSQMHLKYVHYFGGESANAILKARGIITDNQQDTRLLSNKECPNCQESNTRDSKSCQKCHFVLSFQSYQQTIEEQKIKDQEISELKNMMLKMGNVIENLQTSVEFYRKEFVAYGDRFGSRPLTKQEQKKVQGLIKQVDALPPSDDEEVFTD